MSTYAFLSIHTGARYCIVPVLYGGAGFRLTLHRWDVDGNVEEFMRHLHALVMARQEALYLGVSDTPAWVVVKANEYKTSRTCPTPRIMINTPHSRPPPRPNPLLLLPRPLERCLPRHGSRANPHVQRPRPRNRILGLSRRRPTRQRLQTGSSGKRSKVRQRVLHTKLRKATLPSQKS